MLALASSPSADTAATSITNALFSAKMGTNVRPATCKLLLDKLELDIFLWGKSSIQLAQYYHTRDTRICVFQFVDRCWDEGKQIITRPKITAEDRHEAVFRHIYFRYCDASYRNALEEVIKPSSRSPLLDNVRYTRHDGIIYYDTFDRSFCVDGFQHALITTAPRINTLCTNPTIPLEIYNTKKSVFESDEGLAALIDGWTKEHFEATIRNGVAWDVYLSRLKRDLQRHRICNLNIDNIRYRYSLNHHRLEALRAVVEARSDGQAITRKTQLLMRAQFADLEMESGNGENVFRISDLRFTSAELDLAKSYFDAMERDALRLAGIQSGHLSSCASLHGWVFCSNTCQKWQQKNRLASSQEAKEEQGRQGQAGRAATTQAVSARETTQSERKLVGAAGIDQITEGFQRLSIGVQMKGPRLIVSSGLTEAHDPAVEILPEGLDGSTDSPNTDEDDTSIRMASSARPFHEEPLSAIDWNRRYDEDDDDSAPAYAVTSGLDGVDEQPLSDRGTDEDDYLDYVDYDLGYADY